MKGVGLGTGRAFALRLEEGEVLHEAIEAFCRMNGIPHGSRRTRFRHGQRAQGPHRGQDRTADDHAG